MAIPIITAVSAAQATGVNPLPKISCIDVLVTFSTEASALANLTIELSVDGGATWHDCVLHSTFPGTNVAAGSNKRVVVDVRETDAANSGLTAVDVADALVRVVASEIPSNDASDPFESGEFALKMTRPVVTSALMDQFLGWYEDRTNPLTYIDHEITVDCTADTTMLRNSRDLGQLGYGLAGASYVPVGSTQTHRFTNTDASIDSYVTIYMKAYDEFYNESVAVTVAYTTEVGVDENRPWYQYNPPQNCVVTLVGSVGNSDYTGIYIDEATGKFYSDRSITVQVYGRSPIPIEYMIDPDGDVETTADNTDSEYPDAAYPDTHPDDAALSDNVGVYHEFDPEDSLTALKRVRLSFDKGNRTDDFDTDDFAYVPVIFKDAAGNLTTVTPTPKIRLNTRVYKTENTPLRLSDNTYRPVLREDQGLVQVVIDQSLILPDDFIRKWYEIFYPTTHSFPRLPSGELDENAVYALDPTAVLDSGGGGNRLKNAMVAAGYDPLKFNHANSSPYWSIAKDTEGRAIGDSWIMTKDYPSMVSTADSNLEYWVIDNTGYGDFKLEFEFFFLDANVYGPPYNPMSPYKGDCLVVYDASTPGCLEPFVDDSGQTKWELVDASLLNEMFAFTGRERYVLDLRSGRSMQSGPNGDFVTDTIAGISKVVLIFYSDTSVQDAGFKVKAGPAQQKIWSNYDIDETGGEIWVHKHDSLGVPLGSAGTAAKLLTYEYYDRTVVVDLEAGIVKFDEDMSDFEVTVDYSYHEGSTYPVNTFLASWDDFVDFQDAPVYVGQEDSPELTSTTRSHDYEDDGYGRVIQSATWDKDKGVLTFDPDNMPGANQRLFSDYYHHTYTRLSADGHGDLIFRHKVLVPDLTPIYPDYTWADIKIVNEGDAILEDGTLKFGFRGYDTTNDGKPTFPTGNQTGEIVDRVWDMNRPWDIQKGTDNETYKRMACCIQDDFIWDRLCPRLYPGETFTNPTPSEDPRRTNNNMTARGIFQAWQNGPLGDKFAPRTTKYGRVVWILGGSNETGGYPSATSPGMKRCSLEIAGQYYSQLIF